MWLASVPSVDSSAIVLLEKRLLSSCKHMVGYMDSLYIAPLPLVLSCRVGSIHA